VKQEYNKGRDKYDCDTLQNNSDIDRYYRSMFEAKYTYYMWLIGKGSYGKSYCAENEC